MALEQRNTGTPMSIEMFIIRFSAGAIMYNKYVLFSI